MSTRFLLACLVFSSAPFAKASITCRPEQIQPWPQNPVITISKGKNVGLAEIKIERSFYGVSLEDSFLSRLVSDGQRLQMMDANHKLTLETTTLSLLEDVRGQIETTKDGSQTVICRGAL